MTTDNMEQTFMIECAAAFNRFAQTMSEASYEMQTPHAIMRPSLSLDGDKWCALYGDNLQDGVAGFGDSPYEAMRNFDEEWFKKAKGEA